MMGVMETNSNDTSEIIKALSSAKGAMYIGKGLASVAVCGAGAFAMYLTNGDTGIGWAVLGLLLIWV